MEIFTKEGLALLFRWLHIMAGITWIGLLYYFNFVQGPSFAQFEAPARTEAIRKLVPRALWWFRYGALGTLLAGVGIILLRIDFAGWADWDDLLTSSYGISIMSGMVLGLAMFLNVWMVIWPKQKIVIASAEAAAGGGTADPRAADAARRGLLASRTNVIFSIPMVFFMATSSHLTLFTNATDGEKWLYAIIALAVVLLVEANALSGLTGAAKKPLEKVNTTIFSGFVLFGVLYTVLQVITRSP